MNPAPGASALMNPAPNVGEPSRLPSPAETTAQARAAIQQTIDRQKSAAYRALAAFLREPAQDQCVTSAKAGGQSNIIDQGNRVAYRFTPETVQLLFEKLEAARREKVPCHISERQGTPEAPTAGLMVDYDVIVRGSETRLEACHVHRIAGAVVEALRRDLVFPADAVEGPRRMGKIHVFSIVKPAPVPATPEQVRESEASATDETLYKYGFHILVPGVRVSRGYKKYLFRVLRESPAITSILEELGAVGNLAKCLDPGSATVPVLFAGSCKNGATVAYSLGPSFEVQTDLVVGARAEAPPTSFFPMMRELRDDELANYNIVAELSLCYEASYRERAAVAPADRRPLVPAWECECRPEIEAAVDDVEARTRNGAISQEEILFAENSLSVLAAHDPEARFLHQLLDILDPSFSADRNKWRDVIYALANTSETYKPLAQWFSQKCPEKWVGGGREALDQIWEEAVVRRGGHDNPITKRSLIRWAQESDPDGYRRISGQNYFTILSKRVFDFGGTLSHFHVAEVLHAMLGNKFVVDVGSGHRGPETYCWYEFVIPGQACLPGEIWKWRKEVEPDELLLYISRNLDVVFDQVADYIRECEENADEPDEAKYFQKVGGAFLTSRRKLGDSGFKQGVLREAGALFRRRGFYAGLDTEAALLGTGNGVLRLGAACTLIDHFHEFPVMRFTPVHYRPFDPTNPWVRRMLDAIADIIPEPDMRDWVLYFAASSLAGGVKEGLLLLWNGGGANGKTFIMRLIAKALGQYAKKLNIALLTSERESADRPNSAVMQLKGCRFGYVEETQKAEPLNSQRLKEIVNPGEISGRELHRNQETFEITANLMVGQNFKFIVDTADHGTWRRLKFYMSKVKFCSRPDPSNPFEKKDDQNFISRYIDDPDCQSAMLSILVHYYQRLQREHGGKVKNVPCPTLDRETEAFRNDQDAINRFITEAVVHSPGTDKVYPLAEVSAHFSNWYNANIGYRRAVASETINDFENSALQRYIRRAINKTNVLADCRILTPEDSELREGETFLAALDEDPNAADYADPTTWASRVDWWNPPQVNEPAAPAAFAAPAANRTADGDRLLHDDACVFGTGRRQKRAEPRSGQWKSREEYRRDAAADKAYENLFGDDASGECAFSAADVFGPTEICD